ncbi:hypothetical protein N8751_00515 [bacterium]|nr:hypothetical protein [bacterium]
MIKTIIILSLLVLFLLVIFYPKKSCGCKNNSLEQKGNSLKRKDNKYILHQNGDTKVFDTYSQYLKHFYYNDKNEHPISLMESNIVSKVFPGIIEGFEDSKDSVPEEESIPEEEEIIIAEEEETNLNTIREKMMFTIIVKYIEKNMKCIENKDKDKFEKALANYMQYLMDKLLGFGNFDTSAGLASLTSVKFDKYLKTLENIPKCDELINKFAELKSDKKVSDKEKTELKKSIKKVLDKTEKDDKTVTSATIKQKTQDTTTTISSKNQGNIPTITTIINTNRGSVSQNPHGDRRLNPESAPYLKFFHQISKKIQDLNIKVDNITKPSTNKSVNQTSNKVDSSKYIKKEQQIKNTMDKSKNNTSETSVQTNINDEIKTKVEINSKKKVENDNQKLYAGANATKNGLLNDDEKTKDIGAAFNFKPNIKFDHKEPSKKIMSAYGWSYMPPQTWSVPQKRPPVCIPDKDRQATVMPIFDKGTPVDAMSWTQANNLLPKTEYTEKYNANYYYPGWVAQDKVNYPLNKAGMERSEYYNYNLAKKIEE